MKLGMQAEIMGHAKLKLDRRRWGECDLLPVLRRLGVAWSFLFYILDACAGSEAVELTADTGTIQSPGYAKSEYPNDAHCQWHIKASDNKVRKTSRYLDKKLTTFFHNEERYTRRGGHIW